MASIYSSLETVNKERWRTPPRDNISPKLERAWRDKVHKGACFGKEDIDFVQDAPSKAQLAKSKLCCAGCTIRPLCLEYSLASRQRYGVWGGKTEKERRKILGIKAWR